MAYKPIHEDLRELAADILQQGETQEAHLLVGYCINHITSLADALEAKHNAGIAALTDELMAIEREKESCATCRFYSVYNERQFGLCRRNPPVVLITNERMEAQPYTSDSDWCGEFQAQENGG